MVSIGDFEDNVVADAHTHVHSLLAVVESVCVILAVVFEKEKLQWLNMLQSRGTRS